MGLLDWLTDGSLFGGSSSGGTPPVQMTGTDAAPLNSYTKGYDSMYASGAGPTPPTPTPDLPPDPTGGVAAPPTIPATPTPADAPSGLSGAVPIPQPRPADANAAPPIPAPDAPPSVAPPPPAIAGPAPTPAAPPAVIPAGPASAPMSIAPDAAAPGSPAPGGGFMSRFKSALGGGLGAGLTAAGNSAGKSPFQAFASGAGATMSGINDEQHKNTKDAQGYLTAAIAAKRANDDAGYKSNYVQYLLKNSQDKVASKDAAANKNDSPTQLTLGALREVNNDSGVDLSSKRVQQLMKDRGADDPLVLEAVKQHAELVKQKQLEAFARVGVNPKTADEFMKMPGITQDNPIQPSQAGITEKNFAEKMQVGQYYYDKKAVTPKNPKGILVVTPEGLAEAKRRAAGGSLSKSAQSTPAPVDPMNPARGTMPAVAPAAIAEAP